MMIYLSFLIFGSGLLSEVSSILMGTGDELLEVPLELESSLYDEKFFLLKSDSPFADPLTAADMGSSVPLL